jgi:spermidine synthase
MLEKTIQQGKMRMNMDFVPVSYFYSSVLWSSQFVGLEKRIFSFLADLPPFWLLDLPLLVFIAFLFCLWLRKKTTSYLLVPLAVMGLTTIIFEIIVIITFQTLYGYLYQRVALLLSSFMIGLSIGAFWGRMRKRVHFTHILVLQFGLLLLVLAFYFVMGTRIPEFALFLFLLILGFLGGDLFIVANVLFLEQKKNYGLGYGLDLLGSFLGALVASSILIPLMGLPLLLKYLSLLNSFCLLFLFGGFFRR